MPLTLDHIFIFCEPHQAALPESIGLTPGSPNRHAGQGTANTRYFFENAYLELIWIENAAEAQSEITRPTGLWERSRWQNTGASPIGLAFRQDNPNESPPFETWPYRPVYLPAGMEIPIAANSTRLNEPLIFIVPGAIAPINYPADRGQPTKHKAGFRRLSRVEVDVHTPSDFSTVLNYIAEDPMIAIRKSAAPHATLEFDGAANGRGHSIAPDLPIILRG